MDADFVGSLGLAELIAMGSVGSVGGSLHQLHPLEALQNDMRGAILMFDCCESCQALPQNGAFPASCAPDGGDRKGVGGMPDCNPSISDIWVRR